MKYFNIKYFMKYFNIKNTIFYTSHEKIEERLEGIKGKEYVIVMGDWNASVGGGQEKCVGQYGLGKRNERGEKLIEFFSRQELLIMNT